MILLDIATQKMFGSRKSLLFMKFAKSLVYCIMLCSIEVAEARGDAILPWGGASAEVSAWQNKPLSAQGLNSSVSLSGDRKVQYMDHSYYGPYTTHWSISNSAQVYDTKSKMISVSDYASTYIRGSFGSISSYEQVPTEAYAKASWTNDSIHIQSTNGQALPDRIKVVFQATLDLPTYKMMSNALGGIYGSMELSINDKLKNFDAGDYSTTDPNSSLATFFDGGITSTDPSQYASSQTGTGLVSIDLAVHANGWTDPFSVNVSSTPGHTFYHNTYSDFTKGITVGIKDVTTIDGTSLDAAGYKISYASDMTLPSPVPEPSTWIIAVSMITISIVYRRIG